MTKERDGECVAGSHIVTTDSFLTLKPKQVVSVLADHGGDRVELAGHARSVGPDAMVVRLDILPLPSGLINSGTRVHVVRPDGRIALAEVVEVEAGPHRAVILQPATRQRANENRRDFHRVSRKRRRTFSPTAAPRSCVSAWFT